VPGGHLHLLAQPGGLAGDEPSGWPLPGPADRRAAGSSHDGGRANAERGSGPRGGRRSDCRGALMTWATVIGLEVHVQLLTRSKLFCRCSTTLRATATAQVSPTCRALGGPLPAPTRPARVRATRAPPALGCTAHETSTFARKNYF